MSVGDPIRVVSDEERGDPVIIIGVSEGVSLGAQGETGPAGQGVPTGGTTGQVLAKASNTNYDTTWADAASGSGDVVGPASATDGHLAVFDGTTGKLIKDGGAVPTGSVGVDMELASMMLLGWG